MTVDDTLSPTTQLKRTTSSTGLKRRWSTESQSVLPDGSKRGKEEQQVTNRDEGSYQGSIPKRPIAKTAPKILISKKIVQNGPSYNQNGPQQSPKRPTATSKTAHCHYRHSATSKVTLKFYMLRPVIHGLEALMILKQSNVRPCTMV